MQYKSLFYYMGYKNFQLFILFIIEAKNKAFAQSVNVLLCSMYILTMQVREQMSITSRCFIHREHSVA